MGFEFEMGLLPHIEDELKQRGVNLKLKYIPREVFDKRAVDFDYANKKEIIRVGKGEEAKEVWTGNYIFENEWQSFRTKKNPDIELESAWHEYEKKGRYKIAVKVVDILGQDTTQLMDIRIN